MFEKDFFSGLYESYTKKKDGRTEIIGVANEVLYHAKQSIFALQREDQIESEKQLQRAEEKLEKIQEIFKKDKVLEYEGSYKAAVEEYLEARFFLSYVKGEEIGNVTKYKVGVEEYLSGLADFTGELVRRSVLQATKRDRDGVEKNHKVVVKVLEELSHFHITGRNRQKFDETKRNLKRIEEILYDLELRG